MLKDLIKMAGRLDALGLRKEADFADRLIRKVAQETPENEPENKPEVSLKQPYQPSEEQKEYNVTDFNGYYDMVNAWLKGDSNKFSWMNEQSKKFGKSYLNVALENLAKYHGDLFISKILFSKDSQIIQMGRPYMDYAITSSIKYNAWWTMGIISYLKEIVPLTEDEYNKYKQLTELGVSEKISDDKSKDLAQKMKTSPELIVQKYISDKPFPNQSSYTEEEAKAALQAVAEYYPERIWRFQGYDIVSDEIMEMAIASYDWDMENGTEERKKSMINDPLTRKPELRKNKSV